MKFFVVFLSVFVLGATSAISRAEIETDIPDLTLGAAAYNRVAQRIAHFTSASMRGTIKEDLAREKSHDFLKTCHGIFQERGIPLDLCWMVQVESGWYYKAKSDAGAYGYWQFLSDVAREYGLIKHSGEDLRSDFLPSTRAAAEMLTDLYQQFGQWDLAMAAYNFGPGNLAEAIRHAGTHDFWALCKAGVLPEETQNYVPSIIANIQIGNHPKEYGF